MKWQGLNIFGARPIKNVNKYNNNGNEHITDVQVVHRDSNYRIDREKGKVISEPMFKEIRIPKVAVMDLLNNYTLSKETIEVLEKYAKGNTNDDMVLPLTHHDKPKMTLGEIIQNGILIALLSILVVLFIAAYLK